MKAEKAFAKVGTDKGFIHGYDRFYGPIFEDFKPKSLLEIGVKFGHSLAAWRLMFPNCDITGCDIKDVEFSKELIAFSGANIIIEDSTKPKIKERLKNNYDVIIDDGSHYYKDIIRTFKNLHDRFNEYYIIEDWHYDLDIAKRFLNSYGFYNVSFHLSHRSNLTVEKRTNFKTDSRELIKCDEALIIIKR